MSRKPAAYPMFLKKFRGTEEEQAEFLKMLPGDAREDFEQVIAALKASKLTLHEICVEAVNLMVTEGIEKHTSFISGEDNISFGLKEGGRIPKVTIEWVDASEVK